MYHRSLHNDRTTYFVLWTNLGSLTISSYHFFPEMNGLVSYHLIPDSASDSDTDFFQISPEDGTIILTRSLDRESQAKHHLLVMASDQGNPSLSSTAHIWIRGWLFENISPGFKICPRALFRCSNQPVA